MLMTSTLASDSSGGSAVDAAYQRLVDAYLAHDRALSVRLDALMALDSRHVRGWAAKAIFMMSLARCELIPAAQDAARQARICLGDDLDDGLYVRAAECMAGGDWHGAIACFEQLLGRNPRDSMAAKMSHAVRFMLGDAQGMLRSIERVVARSGRSHHHAGFLLGCKAFALEENHRFQEAEFVGRSAVEREAADAWGMHAVSHVYEMTGRSDAGLAWIESHPQAIWGGNNFRYHLLWHQALFLMDLGDLTAALDLYDRYVRVDRTDDFRDIANGASLLKRLELAGVDVGDRWDEMAALCARRIADRSLVFADLHYVMVLAGAGQTDAARTLAGSLLANPARNALQSGLAHRIGAKAAEAVVDHAEGRHAAAAEKLLEVRLVLQAVGGSHAQRDIFEQIMLDAMVRSGHPQAAGLLLVRLGRRGGSNAFAQALLPQSYGPSVRCAGWRKVSAASGEAQAFR